MSIRPMLRADAEALGQIEVRAGARFREVGLGHVADDEPFSPEELAPYADDGRGWVATSADDRPIGYVIVDVVDGNAHVEQVSVDPDAQGAGVGRALLDHVRSWAAATSRPAVTLTTFDEVPWNRPLYEHLGFRVLDRAEIGPELRAVCEHEAAHGLDPDTRVCMQLDLTL